MPVHFNLDQHELRPGDIYEDVFYHPCICLSIDLDNDSATGISLIDGSYPRSCSLRHSGLRLLSLEEAVRWKFHGPADVEGFVAPWLRDDVNQDVIMEWPIRSTGD